MNTRELLRGTFTKTILLLQILISIYYTYAKIHDLQWKIFLFTLLALEILLIFTLDKISTALTLLYSSISASISNLYAVMISGNIGPREPAYTNEEHDSNNNNNFTKIDAIMVIGETGVTFKDVAGQDEAKKELMEVVDFLKNPEKYRKMGARIPQGVLLVGPPGTGKTLMAKAVAGEAGVPFFSVSGSQFVEMYVGVGAARVRDLFKKAKEKAPAIIFIDEIDAIGRKRSGSENSEVTQTLNQLLVEMDGFGADDNIIVLAATNRPDMLDPALMRPGRFDKKVYVTLPTKEDRKAILKLYIDGKPVADNVDIDELADMTTGFSGADLENLVNEAILTAIRKNKDIVDKNDFAEAFEKIIVGSKRNIKLSKEEKERTAYHEIGHAILTKLVDKNKDIYKITITPRGGALGYVMDRDSDKVSITKREIVERVISLLGGRAMEEIKYGHENVSTGASSDIEKATNLIHHMISVWGLDNELGPVAVYSSYEDFLGNGGRSYMLSSEDILNKIDHKTIKYLNTIYHYTIDILNDNMDVIETVKDILVDKEDLDNEEFTNILVKHNYDDRHQKAKEKVDQLITELAKI